MLGRWLRSWLRSCLLDGVMNQSNWHCLDNRHLTLTEGRSDRNCHDGLHGTCYCHSWLILWYADGLADHCVRGSFAVDCQIDIALVLTEGARAAAKESTIGREKPNH